MAWGALVVRIKDDLATLSLVGHTRYLALYWVVSMHPWNACIDGMDELEAVKRLWGRERGADEPVVKEGWGGGMGRKGRGYGSTIGYKARPGMDRRIGPGQVWQRGLVQSLENTKECRFLNNLINHRVFWLFRLQGLYSGQPAKFSPLFEIPPQILPCFSKILPPLPKNGPFPKRLNNGHKVISWPS